jgi:hypothetical protein
MPDLLAFMDLISVFPAIGLGYYAVRMFFLTRLGRLEKGWSLIVGGGFACSVGFCFLAVQDLMRAYSIGYTVTDYIGTSLSAFGFLLVMLGVRSHYSIWSLKNFGGLGKNRSKKEMPRQ